MDEMKKTLQEEIAAEETAHAADAQLTETAPETDAALCVSGVSAEDEFVEDAAAADGTEDEFEEAEEAQDVELTDETEAEEEAEAEASAETDAEAEADEAQPAPARRLRKRMAALIAALICVIGVIGGSTLAYFVQEETSYNVITTSGLKMELVETIDEEGTPWPEDGVSGIVPGMELDKFVMLHNAGEASFYARVKLTITATAEDGVTQLPTEGITMDLDTTYWAPSTVEGEENIYYYMHPLAQDEWTQAPLFTQVSFDKDMGNEYMGSKVVVKVSAQAVQSRNNGDTYAAAAGWPEWID